MVVILLFVIFILNCNCLTILCSLLVFIFYLFIFLTGVRRPQLSKFYLGRVQKARLYINRTFHSLVSLQRLATWGLGLELSVEAIAHELTVRKRKSSFLSSHSFFSFFWSD